MLKFCNELNWMLIKPIQIEPALYLKILGAVKPLYVNLFLYKIEHFLTIIFYKICFWTLIHNSTKF